MNVKDMEGIFLFVLILIFPPRPLAFPDWDFLSSLIPAFSLFPAVFSKDWYSDMLKPGLLLEMVNWNLFINFPTTSPLQSK